MGALQTRLLNKWKDYKIAKNELVSLKSIGDINLAITPGKYNDDQLAVKVNDDYWLNVQLKITNLQGDLEIEKQI